MPAAPPQMMELAASPRTARKPSPDGAADAGLPGTTLRNACIRYTGSLLLCAISWAWQLGVSVKELAFIGLAAPPHMIKLAASSKIADKPSREGAADAGYPGPTPFNAGAS